MAPSGTPAEQQTRPDSLSASPQAVILVTGVTGFLGKVVLEELIRRQVDGTLQFDRLLVLIRAARGKTPSDRFKDKVVGSPCFSNLPTDWHRRVEVISGDLMETACGINADVSGFLTQKITHIIHCAGCVAFDSSLNVLLAENVTASINILELAQQCPGLRRLVLTSTAYVTPHTTEPI